MDPQFDTINLSTPWYNDTALMASSRLLVQQDNNYNANTATQFDDDNLFWEPLTTLGSEAPNDSASCQPANLVSPETDRAFASSAYSSPADEFSQSPSSSSSSSYPWSPALQPASLSLSSSIRLGAADGLDFDLGSPLDALSPWNDSHGEDDMGSSSTPNPPTATKPTRAASPQTAPAPKLRASRMRGVGKTTNSKGSSIRSLASSHGGDDKRRRSCHNLVEKKYRNRLNHQFELLLAALHETAATMAAQADNGDGESDTYADGASLGDGSSTKTLGKAAVLQLAREAVLGLERRNRGLTAQLERMRAVVDGRDCFYGAGTGANVAGTGANVAEVTEIAAGAGAGVRRAVGRRRMAV
ncbi:hypothetical protein B0T26DRAFT_104489 [Lasiosphaeria miniovina]|uniref:BHLH domain-containing protein n=1 Tax=Lasiosphaeria miniovina TaxID=1954250 RepID=A0AA40E8Z7_9PEZI|nr:uncharacterized protein B0T26DRAFT_104489 [Lasiosphaeria miniovina]KAK0726828.1 hypothetical protein B0T26DRAFT_104489 [Lasiosphaeria miniovina]